MKRLLLVLLGVGAAVVAAVASTFLAMLIFGAGVCQWLDDTGGPFPAADSPQGRVCGNSSHASGLQELAMWSIPAAGVLAVLVLLAVWRWGSHTLRYVGVVGLFVMPFLPIVPLAVPSDTCSAEEIGTVGRDCATES